MKKMKERENSFLNGGIFMKSISKFMMGFAVMALALTGCGSKASNGEAESQVPSSTQETVSSSQETANDVTEQKASVPVELTLWHETEEGISSILQAELDKLAPDIKVNVERKENMTEALKLAAADPSNAPDFIWFAHDKIGLFAEMGIIDPIDDYVDAGTFDKFVPLTSEAGLYNGKHYQIPAYYETLMFMYNKALLDKAPTTTDELLELCKSKTSGDHYGFVEQHSTGYYISAWVHAFGAQILNDKVEPGLDTKEMMDAIDYHKQFVEYMPKDGEWNTVTTLFLEGKADAIVNGPWFVASAKDAGIDLGVAPLPVVSATNKALTPYSGVQGIMVSSACKDKEAAKKVLALLSGKDLSEQLALKNGAAPAQLEAYENPDVQSNEVIMTLKSCAENAVPMPNVPQMDVMWSSTENALAAIYKNGEDTKTALEAGQKAALEQIAAMQ